MYMYGCTLTPVNSSIALIQRRRAQMLRSLADRINAHPRRVLGAVAVFAVLAAAAGGPVLGLLQADGGFTDSDSDSARAEAQIERVSGSDPSAEVIALLTPGSPVRSAAGREQIREVAGELGSIPGVTSVASAADGRAGADRFISTDGNSTYIAATLSASADDDAEVAALDKQFGSRDDVTLGGSLLANELLGDQISEDLGRAEMLAFPILILLSFVFFRGARAALMPLIVGVTTIFSTFLVLRGINEVHELSVFCLNLVIGLGLGLAIDYTLFLLTRYREELERSGPGAQALRDTMATAGRTVVFSAATVALAMATLTVFPLNFLQSMGIGGASVAVIAALASLTIAPALFALWNVKLKARDRGGAHDRWYRIARRVMARPGLIAAVTAVLMVALAIPSLRAVWTPVDIDTVPEGHSARTVGDALASGFPGQDSSPVLLVAEAEAGEGAEVRSLADRVAATDGIASVQPPERLDASTWRIDAIAEGDAAGDAARGAVESIRADSGPLPVLVGGEAASFIDQQQAIGSRMPLAIGLLAGLTFMVLWLMTGSVVLPLKALVMNALTVGSTLGLLTLIFQDGRLEGLLGYSSDGGIEPTDFLVTATLVFALSTDYGVFLLGRIKEAHDAGMPDREAVATGLARTGAVVTAAAVLLAVAIGAFVTSEVLFIKQIGVGAALGVLIDALVVRALLVPSLMALLGPWNWWSPKSLRRLHDRIGLSEEGGGAAARRIGGAGSIGEA
jgi:RND superfamily putative drug exporter